MKHLVTLFLFLSTITFAQEKVANYNLEDPIPKDTSAIRGELKNGLKYYILKNDRPKKTVEMRLMVKVGSLQEEEDQLGLAHILEHLLFNGTKNFPKHKIIEYLENIGLKFGADLNAHTGFDETVYKLSIPTEDKEKIDTAFQILEDWSHNALLEDSEIEAERGVVMEEYRIRLKGINERIKNAVFDEFYGGTRERDRLPIGTEESILNFDPQRLRDFYTTWYRPNLMSVAIVGDIDVAYAEAKIKEHFSALKNPENPKELKKYNDDFYHKEKKIKIITDPELTSTGVQISILDKEKQAVDGALIKELYNGIKNNILNQMLNNRFQELSYQKKPPFLSAGAYRSRTLVANQMSFSLGASVGENKTITGLKSLGTELERAYRFGFTENELENAKKNILSSNESLINKKDERYSKSLIGELLSEYKEKWAFTSVDWEYEFTKKIIPTITLEMIQNKLKEYYHADNQNILVLVPEKEGAIVPKKEEVLSIIKGVEEDTSITAYAGKDLGNSLIKEKPVKGSITNTEALAHNIKKMTLNNGIDVYYKITDFDTDYVGFKAFSYGGRSLFSDEENKTIGVALNSVKGTGVGGFKTYELEKILSGKKVRIRPYVGTYDEGLSGNSKVTDMETLFQLIHLSFTSVNKDEETYRTVTNRSKEWYKNQLLNPKRVFFNVISKTYNEGNPRYVNVYENNNYAKIIDETPYSKVYNKYTERFENAADFKFFFIGDFKEAQLKEYAETYLASLPGVKENKETYKLHKFNREFSEKEITVHKGLAEKAAVRFSYSHKKDFNAKENKAMKIFKTILQRKLRNAIREEKSGTYGVRVSLGHSSRPIPKYNTRISFECDPKNVEDLKKEVIKVVNNFVQTGPTKDEVKSVKEQWSLERKKQLRKNGFWLGQMRNKVYWKKPIEKMFTDDKLNKSISHKFIKKTASKIIGKPSVIAILLPEKKTDISAKK